MTTTFQTTDSIGAGVRFTIAAAYDRYTVIAGVNVISTDFYGVYSNVAGSSISIDGSIYAAQAAISLDVNANGSSIYIGTRAIVSSTAYSEGPIIVLGAAGASLVNHGQIAASSGVGILSNANTTYIQNFGAISGASGVFMGMFEKTGNRLTNGGTISAGSFNLGFEGTQVNNAVFSKGADTGVVNLAGGILSAISADGNGVRFGVEDGDSDMDGSSVINHGQIVSAQSDGVRFAGQADDTLTLINHGTITGAGWAFRGDVQTDLVTNRGMMRGSVDLGDGADTFDGRGGTVTGTVYGGTGDDTYVVSDSTIALEELFDDGIDLVASEVDWVLGENFENLYLLGIADTRGYGNGLGNTITGNSGDNRLRGGGGKDMLGGGDGDDDLRGQAGLDTLIGGDGDDILRGGDGNDRLNGGDGNDTLIGGAGGDKLTGGADADVFRFNIAAHSPNAGAADQITDFTRGEDLIDLSGLNATPVFIGSGAFSGTGAEVRIAASGPNRLVMVDMDGDGSADMKIIVIGMAGLESHDFIL
jgi:Ca2+-binding RTX toxin-like protein